MEYKASRDKTVHIITVGVIILFVFLGYKSIMGLVHANRNLIPIFIYSSIITFLIGTISLSFLYAPRKYYVTLDNVIIHRPLSDKTIPIDSIIQIRPISKTELKGTIRTFGVGGLFGYYGKFYSKGLGSFTMFGTQSKNYILIKTKNKKIVITPDDIGIIEHVKNLNPASL
jgi:hypothetical protein